MGEQRRIGPPEREIASGRSNQGSGTGNRIDTAPRVAPLSYSDREVSSTKDFAEFTDEEMRQARAMMDRLRWEPGSAPDTPLAILQGPHAGSAAPGSAAVCGTAGNRSSLPTRARRWKRRPLIVLCDVSGSMERYARMLLLFHPWPRQPARPRRGVPVRHASDANHARDRPTRLGGGRIARAEGDAGLGRRHAHRRCAAHLQPPMGAQVAGNGPGRAADFRRLGSRRSR